MICFVISVLFYLNPGALYCLLACLFPCIPIMLLRQEARERYNIEVTIILLYYLLHIYILHCILLQGSTGSDAIASFCCGACVSCQTSVEIKERGDNN